MTGPARVDIRSAHDIVAALESPDLATRLALCQAAASHPAHVLAYGAAAGVDLVQAFLSAARRRESLLFRKATLGALVNFDDPRVVELFREVLLTSGESDVLRLAARRVALDPSHESREFLRERLLNDASPLRVRCIASALTSLSDLNHAEQLRCVLAGVGTSGAVHRLPHEEPAGGDSWARELAGPFALTARRLLERSGTRADWLALSTSWSRWDDADRAWFVHWGRTLFTHEDVPPEVCALLTRALAHSAKSVVLAALAWCGSLPDAAPRSAVEPWCAAGDPELRLAALSALPLAAVDWLELARSDRDPGVRALAIERGCARSAQPGDAALPYACEDWARFIDDDDWRVRAAVVRALNQNGHAAIDTARAWLAHASPKVRAGALQILLDQGQERWLVETLIG